MDMNQIRRDCDELRKMDPLEAMQRVFGAMKDGGGSSLAILALDKGIAEVIRLRNAVTFADQQGAEAIERVSSAIIADKWNATAEFQARALKAEAERDELRLTLAAEQGQAEGAPSSRWRCDGRHWYADRGDGGMDKIELQATLHGDGTVTHKRVWIVQDMHGFEQDRGWFDLARPTMIAADEALKAGSPS